MADEDTITSGAGTDGPAGGAGDDTIVETPTPPEPAAPEPEKQPEPVPAPPITPAPAARAPVVVEPDDIDREFDGAIEAISNDEILTDGQKRAEKLKLTVTREERQQRRQREQAESEEAHRNEEARLHGVTRQQVDTAWKDAVAETMIKKGGKFDRGYAQAIYDQKIAAVTKPNTPTPAPPKPAPTPTPVLGKGQVLPRGVGAVPPQPTPTDTRTVEEKNMAGELGKNFASIYEEVFGGR